MASRNADGLQPSSGLQRSGRLKITPLVEREIQQRTPRIAGNGDEHVHTQNGSIIATRKNRRITIPKLPFQVYASASKLFVAAGTIDNVGVAVTEQDSPANGDWYALAKVTYSTTTGVPSAREVVWSQTESTGSAGGTSWLTIGQITVTDGVPVKSTIIQYNYGPVLGHRFAESSGAWSYQLF